MPRRKGRLVQLAANAKKAREAIKKPRLLILMKNPLLKGPVCKFKSFRSKKGELGAYQQILKMKI